MTDATDQAARRGRGRPRVAYTPRATAQGPRDVRQAIGYVRVSTGDQADHGYGLDAQRTAIRAYIEAQGWTLVGIVEDQGVSGTYGLDDVTADGSPRRPGLATALDAVETGRADALVVKALDRIGRAPAVCATVFARLDRALGTFASITEPALSSDLLRGLYAGMASDERRRILDRTRDGRMAKIALGGPVGRVPFGYRLVGTRRAARVEIVEDQATIVRRVFALRAGGITIAAITAVLNSDAIPAPQGGTWSTATIGKMVNNPAYHGTLRWREGVEIIREEVLPVIVPAATPFRGDGGDAGHTRTRATAAA